MCSNLSLEYWGAELGRGCCVVCLITFQGLDIIKSKKIKLNIENYSSLLIKAVYK